jgi:hypothetical protein
VKRLLLMSFALGALLYSQSAPNPNPAPCPNPNCETGGIPKKDGTGPGAKKGKRTGPQDGSGPLHTPPNSGKGRRGGGRR